EVVPGQAGIQEKAVEIRALEARILECEPHGVHREADRRVAVDLPLRRDAAADDRGRAAERMSRHAASGYGGVARRGKRPKRRDSPWRSTATRSVRPRSRASSSSHSTGSSIGSYDTTKVPQ